MAQLAKSIARTSPELVSHSGEVAKTDSLFEQFDWIYIFCRERIFRDDTLRMIAALWPTARPQPVSNLIELGCGPGFYSRNLASIFPELNVVGLDRSQRQLEYARDLAVGLNNCHFERGDVLNVSRPSESFDYLIASRLFTVLPRPDRAVAEMFRLLKPAGRCFIAEPRFKFWAAIPLSIMRVVASVSGQANGCREPNAVTVFQAQVFERLFRTQPWKTVRVWQKGRYQYALCEKG